MTTPAGFLGSIGGVSFDEVLTPTVTSGAYSAGDIIGGVLAFPVGRVGHAKVTLQGLEIVSKAAVTPTWSAVLLSEAPATPTDYDDNDAYSLAVADAFKFRGVIPNSEFTLTDHGTPNTWIARALGRVYTTDADGIMRIVLIDAAGVTLTSTADIQVRVYGYQD